MQGVNKKKRIVMPNLTALVLGKNQWPWGTTKRGFGRSFGFWILALNESFIYFCVAGCRVPTLSSATAATPHHPFSRYFIPQCLYIRFYSTKVLKSH